MTRFLPCRPMLLLLTLGSLAVAGLAPLAAQSPDNPLPAPTHPIHLGYYHVDAPRYGDSWHAVSCYTDLYYVGMLTDYQCPVPDGTPDEGIAQWLPRMQGSLARAASQGKRLLVDLALNDPSMMDPVSCSISPAFYQAFDALAPYWSNVDLLELADEPPILPGDENHACWDRANIEATAASLNAHLDQLGLPHRPMGISLGKSALINAGLGASHPKNSPAIEWIGIEAYLCSPTVSCPSTEFPQGSTDPSTNAAILQTYLAEAKAAVPVDPNDPTKKKIVLIMQAYDRNGSWLGNIPSVTAMQWAAYDAAYADPRVIALNMFSYGREAPGQNGGTHFHPEFGIVHRWIAERLYNATFPGLCSTQPPIDLCALAPLGAPSNLAASATGNQVTLTWQDNSSDETGFELERQVPAGAWTKVATLGANATSAVNNPPAPPAGGSVSYNYRVRAVRGAQASAYSNAAAITLWADPPATAPSAIGPNGCITTTLPTYQWTSVARATRYYLVATRADVESFFINNPNVPGTSFPQPTPLTSGVQYRWKVKACNNAGCSAYTPSIFFTPFCAPTQAPNLLSPQGCTASLQPVLTWSAVAGATQYKIAVYRVVDVNNDVLTYYQDVPGTSFTPPAPLLAGQEYRFKVKAKAGTQDGPFSRHRYFTPQCGANQKSGTASPISPWFAPVTGGTPTFTWEIASNTADYLLVVASAAGTILHQQWYPAATICSGTECSVQPPLNLPAGSYGWQLQTRNATGLGPWGPGTSFTVP